DRAVAAHVANSVYGQRAGETDVSSTAWAASSGTRSRTVRKGEKSGARRGADQYGYVCHTSPAPDKASQRVTTRIAESGICLFVRHPSLDDPAGSQLRVVATGTTPIREA